MKTLLVLLLVSGLAVESQAWISWSEIKASVKDKFEDVKDTWNEKVVPFFTGIAKKAKDFVTGKKGEFEKLANRLRDHVEKLEDCKRCEDGDCTDVDDVECEERYINYEKVKAFMDCMDDSSRTDCSLNLGRSVTPPPKTEEDKRVEEDRRAEVFLRELLKKPLK